MIVTLTRQIIATSLMRVLMELIVMKTAETGRMTTIMTREATCGNSDCDH